MLWQEATRCFCLLLTSYLKNTWSRQWRDSVITRGAWYRPLSSRFTSGAFSRAAEPFLVALALKLAHLPVKTTYQERSV